MLALAGIVLAGLVDGHSDLSAPREVLLFRGPQCSLPLGGKATIGEHVYSARHIYKVSNEAELCYSYSGPDVAVRSIKWRCSEDGLHIHQMPFSSKNCSGEQLLKSPNSTVLSAPSGYDSSMWSGVLNGDTCLTQDKVDAFGFLSFRFNSGLDSNVRPRCVQSWLAMEQQVAAAVADKERMESKLRRQKQRIQAVATANDESLKHKFFAIGAGLGVVVGIVASTLLRICRSMGGKKHVRSMDGLSGVLPLGEDGEELSCSMLPAGERGEDLDFAALPG